MKRIRIQCTLASLFPLVYVLLDQFQKQLQESYSQNFEFPFLVFVLNAVSPIVCPILLIAKGVFWIKTNQRFRWVVDVSVTLLMVVAILLFYNHFGLLYLISKYRDILLLMCIQLGFVVYDFIR